MVSEAHVKVILGLKIKQMRGFKDLSLFGLSKKTGLSKSYLNEIEKGKKYPKTDKIILLAEALEVDYEELVSLKLTGNMAPLAEILQSGVLKEIPLDLFGISETDLIDIIAEAPEKTSAFINTLFDIAKSVNLKRDTFFLSALRSYQEMHLNWFPEIETFAEQALVRYGLNAHQQVSSEDLMALLQEEFNFSISRNELQDFQFPEVRSIFTPGNQPKLWLSPSLSESQMRFVLAKELGYCVMGISPRPETFTWIQFDTFDEVLNNFKASYFAGAFLLPKNNLYPDLLNFFNSLHFEPNAFHEIQTKYSETPETFLHRLTNILPGLLNIKELFFLRFSINRTQNIFELTKELHLSKTHNPHGNRFKERYCARWLSIAIGKNPNKYHAIGESFIGTQISHYPDGRSYYILSTFTPDNARSQTGRSICIGFELTPANKRKVKFIDDPKIENKNVGVTCESCPRLDCTERIASPKHILKEQRNQEIMAAVRLVQQTL